MKHTDSKVLPEPYRSLPKLLPFNPKGWYLNSRLMGMIIRKYKVKTVVEVGSWFGASTRHIAETVPASGRVYAVDTWLGTTDEFSKPFCEEASKIAYEQFLSNVIHAGLTHKIIPVRKDSLQAAKMSSFFPKIDLVYIDANHQYENVLKDLHAWYPYIEGRGIICGDDLRMKGKDQNVEEAVREFAREKKLDVYHDGWFWYHNSNKNAKKITDQDFPERALNLLSLSDAIRFSQ